MEMSSSNRRVHGSTKHCRESLSNEHDAQQRPQTLKMDGKEQPTTSNVREKLKQTAKREARKETRKTRKSRTQFKNKQKTSVKSTKSTLTGKSDSVNPRKSARINAKCPATKYETQEIIKHTLVRPESQQPTNSEAHDPEVSQTIKRVAKKTGTPDQKEKQNENSQSRTTHVKLTDSAKRGKPIISPKSYNLEKATTSKLQEDEVKQETDSDCSELELLTEQSEVIDFGIPEFIYFIVDTLDTNEDKNVPFQDDTQTVFPQLIKDVEQLVTGRRGCAVPLYLIKRNIRIANECRLGVIFKAGNYTMMSRAVITQKWFHFTGYRSSPCLDFRDAPIQVLEALLTQITKHGVILLRLAQHYTVGFVLEQESIYQVTELLMRTISSELEILQYGKTHIKFEDEFAEDKWSEVSEESDHEHVEHAPLAGTTAVKSKKRNRRLFGAKRRKTKYEPIVESTPLKCWLKTSRKRLEEKLPHEFQCDRVRCKYSAPFDQWVDLHIRTTHQRSQYSDKRWFCQQCQLVFLKSKDLKEHNKGHGSFGGYFTSEVIALNDMLKYKANQSVPEKNVQKAKKELNIFYETEMAKDFKVEEDNSRDDLISQLTPSDDSGKTTIAHRRIRNVQESKPSRPVSSSTEIESTDQEIRWEKVLQMWKNKKKKQIIEQLELTLEPTTSSNVIEPSHSSTSNNLINKSAEEEEIQSIAPSTSKCSTESTTKVSRESKLTATIELVQEKAPIELNKSMQYKPWEDVINSALSIYESMSVSTENVKRGPLIRRFGRKIANPNVKPPVYYRELTQEITVDQTDLNIKTSPILNGSIDQEHKKEQLLEYKPTMLSSPTWQSEPTSGHTQSEATIHSSSSTSISLNDSIKEVMKATLSITNDLTEQVPSVTDQSMRKCEELTSISSTSNSSNDSTKKVMESILTDTNKLVLQVPSPTLNESNNEEQQKSCVKQSSNEIICSTSNSVIKSTKNQQVKWNSRSFQPFIPSPLLIDTKFKSDSIKKTQSTAMNQSSQKDVPIVHKLDHQEGTICLNSQALKYFFSEPLSYASNATQSVNQSSVIQHSEVSPSMQQVSSGSHSFTDSCESTINETHVDEQFLNTQAEIHQVSAIVKEKTIDHPNDPQVVARATTFQKATENQLIPEDRIQSKEVPILRNPSSVLSAILENKDKKQSEIIHFNLHKQAKYNQIRLGIINRKCCNIIIPVDTQNAMSNENESGRQEVEEKQQVNQVELINSFQVPQSTADNQPFVVNQFVDDILTNIENQSKSQSSQQTHLTTENLSTQFGINKMGEQTDQQLDEIEMSIESNNFDCQPPNHSIETCRKEVNQLQEEEIVTFEQQTDQQSDKLEVNQESNKYDEIGSKQLTDLEIQQVDLISQQKFNELEEHPNQLLAEIDSNRQSGTARIATRKAARKTAPQSEKQLVKENARRKFKKTSKPTDQQKSHVLDEQTDRQLVVDEVEHQSETQQSSPIPIQHAAHVVTEPSKMKLINEKVQQKPKATNKPIDLQERSELEEQTIQHLAKDDAKHQSETRKSFRKAAQQSSRVATRLSKKRSVNEDAQRKSKVANKLLTEPDSSEELLQEQTDRSVESEKIHQSEIRNSVGIAAIESAKNSISWNELIHENQESITSWEPSDDEVKQMSTNLTARDLNEMLNYLTEEDYQYFRSTFPHNQIEQLFCRVGLDVPAQFQPLLTTEIHKVEQSESSNFITDKVESSSISKVSQALLQNQTQQESEPEVSQTTNSNTKRSRSRKKSTFKKTGNPSKKGKVVKRKVNVSAKVTKRHKTKNRANTRQSLKRKRDEGHSTSGKAKVFKRN